MTSVASRSSGAKSAHGSTTSWKEHVLDNVTVPAEDVGDAITCLLHTVLFTRAPGPVRPSEASCQAFPNITYALCAVGDVSRKVDHAVRSFEELVVGGESLAAVGGSRSLTGTLGGALVTSNGQPLLNSAGASSTVRGGHRGYVVVTFFERTVKKALFGLMSNEEKTVFEKWIVPVTVASLSAASQEEKETCAGETEAALQNALLHILTAVQSIEHIPKAMYDFDIMTCTSLDSARDGSIYGAGLGSSSVGLMA
ncbi:unnamed protein product [Hyaloperonospora brassicae]|uniref:Autophagy-related protein 101 n=1 Tax=Hyaloperonospora brassicae TaxID=162125 RepID=A0AAV0UG48_HYABA|nr:unnamed protein product [Hyaloperonospora brassicae]